MKEYNEEEIEAAIAFMKERNTKLFDELGVSPEVLSSLMSDSSRFKPETWKSLQQYKQAIEEWIASGEPPRPSKKQAPTPGHWIFVR